MHPPIPEPVSEPRHRRGRSASVRTRQAVLKAAAALLEERGLAGFTVDEVARRSKVSKSTIYRHWSGGLPIAVEAYGAKVTDTISNVPTGAVTEGLIAQVRQIAAVYAGPEGPVIAQLLGAGAAVEGGPRLVRDRFFAERRALTLRLVEQGIAEGLWLLTFPRDLVPELLFGPIVFRALNGGPPLSPDEAEALARTALRGLATHPID